MRQLATEGVPTAGDRLRWRDLLPVLGFVVAGVLLVFTILLGLARTNRAFYQANAETIVLLATLAIYTAFGAGLAFAVRRMNDALAYLRIRRPTSTDLGLIVVLLIPWYLGITLVSAISAALFNGGHVVPGNSRQLFVQHPQGIGILILALLVTAVAAPVCEEVFFRGMLFRLLRRRFPLWVAVVLSAAAFGLAHASPAINLALLPVFFYMGVVLAVLYLRSGSLTNTMLLHAINNAVGTVLVFSVLSR
jgi:membrane protease YdiL (CAAX protease family)